ncbi:hypothetical protein LBBP_03525 [Leptospira borgpetersenii serovar Ballum]|uniref:Uncharacterized protein n=1 Tax=Leptospira borgpetersenii serovar Ballum TaxID=280505 RepID=A0A0S2IVN8_LEPBO|nr:hypothetical protein LBBP_03525 [Leptospira borgpetersenii serovar Ballum]
MLVIPLLQKTVFGQTLKINQGILLRGINFLFGKKKPKESKVPIEYQRGMICRSTVRLYRVKGNKIY